MLEHTTISGEQERKRGQITKVALLKISTMDLFHSDLVMMKRNVISTVRPALQEGGGRGALA